MVYVVLVLKSPSNLVAEAIVWSSRSEPRVRPATCRGRVNVYRGVGPDGENIEKNRSLLCACVIGDERHGKNLVIVLLERSISATTFLRGKLGDLWSAGGGEERPPPLLPY